MVISTRLLLLGTPCKSNVRLKGYNTNGISRTSNCNPLSRISSEPNTDWNDSSDKSTLIVREPHFHTSDTVEHGVTQDQRELFQALN